jgi:hypothetical protein
MLLPFLLCLLKYVCLRSTFRIGVVAEFDKRKPATNADKITKVEDKNFNGRYRFFVLSFYATIKHRCVTHLYGIPLLSFYFSVDDCSERDIELVCRTMW